MTANSVTSLFCKATSTLLCTAISKDNYYTSSCDKTCATTAPR